jgi:hypothetical protein
LSQEERLLKKCLSMMKIPIPKATEVHEIQTEMSLPTLQLPPAWGRKAPCIESQPGRIDVFMRTQGANPFVFFIENKVVEQDSKIPELLEQIEKYYNHFKKIPQGDPSYCPIIYPAYFGFEADTGEKLKKLAEKKHSPVAGPLICFPAEEMLEAFKDTGFEKDQILKDFYQWLTSRKAFIRFISKARDDKHVKIEEVIEASKPLGFGDLLEAFYKGFKGCSKLKGITTVRVDKKCINFFIGSKTPISIHWYDNSGINGLYVGLCEDFNQIVRLSKTAMPDHFAYVKSSRVCLSGYFKTVEEIENFWNGIS